MKFPQTHNSWRSYEQDSANCYLEYAEIQPKLSNFHTSIPFIQLM